MTRKHFESIAKIVRDSSTDPINRYDLAKAMARFCATQNTRFDHARFFEACGVPNLWSTQ